MVNMFDDPAGIIIAKIMAKQNAAAEAEAVATLAPAPSANILAIGFGPGVGVCLLAGRLTTGTVVGVDPSSAMMREAGRRNRAEIKEGKTSLAQATADAIQAPDSHFDGAIAVNTLQLCEPIEPTARELARVLRSGARLVTLTHDWALTHHAGSVEARLEQIGGALGLAGFIDIRSFSATAERGRSVALIARRN